MRPYSTKPSPSRSPWCSIQPSAASICRPERPQRLGLPGAVQPGAGQRHEQRRRIDAAVVAAERHLAQFRHLAVAHLVQDLAGLGIRRRIEAGGLHRRQVPQHAERDGRVEPERQPGGDQRIPAEDGAEPGHAGIGEGPFRRLRAQHGQVGAGPADHLVEAALGGGDAGRARLHRAAGPAVLPQRAQEGGIGRLARLVVRVAAGLDQQGAALPGTQRQVEDRLLRRQPVRRRLEAQPGLPPPRHRARYRPG